MGDEVAVATNVVLRFSGDKNTQMVLKIATLTAIICRQSYQTELFVHGLSKFCLVAVSFGLSGSNLLCLGSFDINHDIIFISKKIFFCEIIFF